MYKKTNLITDLTITNNSKHVVDMNIRCNAIRVKLLKENISKKVYAAFSLVMSFYMGALPMKENIKNLDFIKIKNPCSLKDTVENIKRQA